MWIDLQLRLRVDQVPMVVEDQGQEHVPEVEGQRSDS